MQDSDENEYFKPIYVIAAACKNMGIGNDSGLPWNLPNEFRYFMDRVTSVTAPGKKNLIVCGKNSFNIPEKYLPLENCLVAMLSTTLSAAPKYVQYLCRDFPTAIKIGSTPSLGDTVEKIWIIGGPKVFKISWSSKWHSRGKGDQIPFPGLHEGFKVLQTKLYNITVKHTHKGPRNNYTQLNSSGQYDKQNETKRPMFANVTVECYSKIIC
ncbi:dihydrofolate reductase-like isoform X1 [Protopterus annectens]|uniref:dihydrofolate reductase-like isoform X1 n=1 Tax=Protopterus annectens TaxID=7888 RepID=UPI001CFBE026|nr:dihydrofolate reductase-like isoform X1 [Protopterus annectens]